MKKKHLKRLKCRQITCRDEQEALLWRDRAGQENRKINLSDATQVHKSFVLYFFLYITSKHFPCLIQRLYQTLVFAILSWAGLHSRDKRLQNNPEKLLTPQEMTSLTFFPPSWEGNTHYYLYIHLYLSHPGRAVFQQPLHMLEDLWHGYPTQI